MPYVSLLRVERIGPLLAAMAVARLTIGINGLAVVLFLREERGSFAVAGLVAGAMALGTGLGAPLQGRLVDRIGRRVLLPVAAGHASWLVALVVLGHTAVPAVVLAACALAAGASMPPVSSVLRSLYPTLLTGRPELVRAAFALDSVVTELLFVAGPLLVAVLVVVLAPEAALLVSAATVVAGTAAFLALLPSVARETDAAGRGRALGGPGALASPGLVTLILTMLPFGVAFGMVEVVLPAFARAHGDPGMAGLLLAVWSVASAAGGLLYGLRAAEGALEDVHLALAVAVPVVFLPLALAPSELVMALVLLPAGLPIAPLIATRNELAGQLAPEGAATEAYTWVLMAMVGGIALGAGLAGVLVDEAGWRTAAGVAAGMAGVGTLVALGRRSSLRAAVASA